MPNVITEAKIFPCEQSKVLAEKIAVSYGTDLGKVITSKYSDGEFQPSYEAVSYTHLTLPTITV